MFDDLMEAEILSETKPGPPSEEDIDDEGQEYEPRECEDDMEQRIPSE